MKTTPRQHTSVIGVLLFSKGSLIAAKITTMLFMILNWIAFFGWTFVCYKLLFLLWNDGDEDDHVVQNLQKPVLVLEGICAIEVLRILLGQLKGNFVLGQ